MFCICLIDITFKIKDIVYFFDYYSGVLLSSDLETEGFDTEAGKTWIYPTNYSLREYQFNIVQEALFKNTLVAKHKILMIIDY